MVLPRGRGRVVASTRLILSDISMFRVCCMGIVTLYRIFVGFALIYSGTIYIANTIELDELVLNAVALQVVLEVDELFFGALSTSASRTLLANLEPLRLPNMPSKFGADIGAVCNTLVLFSVLSITAVKLLLPNVDILAAVATELCGHNRNFVVDQNKLRMAVIVATESFEESFVLPPSAYRSAVEEALYKERVIPGEGARATWFESARIKAFGHLDIRGEIDRLQPQCKDNLESFAFPYMQEAIGDNISSCEDITHLCSNITVLPAWIPDNGASLWAKALCPETCGCNQPDVTHMLIGCPSICWQNPLTDTERECKDLDAGDLVWATMQNNWKEFSAFYRNEHMTNMAATLVLGCESIPLLYDTYADLWTPGDACSGSLSFPFRGLASFCPESCQCHRLYRTCPTRCRHYPALEKDDANTNPKEARTDLQPNSTESHVGSADSSADQDGGQ